jgi:hypothetical protein
MRTSFAELLPPSPPSLLAWYVEAIRRGKRGEDKGGEGKE